MFWIFCKALKTAIKSHFWNACLRSVPTSLGALLLEPLATSSAPHGHRVQACHLKSVTFVGLDVRNCAGPGVVDSTPAKISKVLRVIKRLVLIPRRRDAFSLCDHPSWEPWLWTSINHCNVGEDHWLNAGCPTSTSNCWSRKRCLLRCLGTGDL